MESCQTRLKRKIVSTAGPTPSRIAREEARGGGGVPVLLALVVLPLTMRPLRGGGLG